MGLLHPAAKAMMRRLIIVFLVSVGGLQAASTDSLFRVELAASMLAQITSYDAAPTAFSESSEFFGSSYTGRALWRPNHYLGVGLQSGYTTFSQEEFGRRTEFGPAAAYASLRAIPLQIVLSMRSHGIEVGAGIGVYLLESIWRVNGVQRVNSTAGELGVSSWIGYDVQIFDRFYLGPEVNIHVLSGRGIASLGAGLRIRYDVLRY